MEDIVKYENKTQVFYEDAHDPLGDKDENTNELHSQTVEMGCSFTDCNQTPSIVFASTQSKDSEMSLHQFDERRDSSHESTEIDTQSEQNFINLSTETGESQRDVKEVRISNNQMVQVENDQN